jgi:uncharacterized protein YkwD
MLRVFILLGLVLLFVYSNSTPKSDLVDHYNTSIATIATVAAYESLTERANEPEVVESVGNIPETDSVQETVMILDSDAQVVFDGINAERAKSGLKPFVLSDELVGAASNYGGGKLRLGQYRVVRAFTTKSPVKVWMSSWRTRSTVLTRRATEAGVAFDGKSWVLVVR